VPRVRDLLYRFRPAGAPGAAGPAGVPANRDAERATELEPLFAQLADAERECAEIREQGRRDAERIRARGVEEARSILAAATAGIQAARAAASAQMQRKAETESAALLASAQAQAAAVRESAAQRIPEYVDLAVESVRTLLGKDGTAVRTG
jgi:hypothetical protein